MLLLLFYGVGTSGPVDTGTGRHAVRRRIILEPVETRDDEDVLLVRIL